MGAEVLTDNLLPEILINGLLSKSSLPWETFGEISVSWPEDTEIFWSKLKSILELELFLVEIKFKFDLFDPKVIMDPTVTITFL